MAAKRYRMTYARSIAMGFLIVICCGTLLLTLPVASKSGDWTALVNAFFTATSATCVTGLIIGDTYTYWSLFGQIVILLLIQIGGLGFMTMISMFTIFARKNVSFHERRLLMESFRSMQYNGIVALLKRILIGTFCCEFLGAVILSLRFVPQMGLGQGIYYGIFHSVSAFCNAGFDLMGKYREFSSFTDYTGDAVVCLTLISLIIIGGLGFLVWTDLAKNKFHFQRFSLHSKIVLSVTAFLICFGWGAFYFSESQGVFANLNGVDKAVAALFQSVSPRTAGFNSVDQASLSDTGYILTLFYMFVGGSPGSTAGGIKTTTIFVVLICAIASARNSDTITVFKKRLDNVMVRQATSIVTIYFAAVILATAVICIIEPFDLEAILFDVVSAVGTVGLSFGITPSLTAASKIILSLLMFFGRIGGLTLFLVLLEKNKKVPVERPVERILIG
ncbi:MAG TPA: potassium transporter TrkG [Clostridiales bacterium]|nr:potassium transporter TrkG [Clostridiales bacterium]